MQYLDVSRPALEFIMVFLDMLNVKLDIIFHTETALTDFYLNNFKMESYILFLNVDVVFISTM